MAYNWNAIQQQAQAGLAPKGPGLGGQVAGKVANKVVADQVAKAGLGAAGTAIGGPLGGAAGTALGELAGPLAGQLIGGLFNKGGPVHMDRGGWIQAILAAQRAAQEASRRGDKTTNFAKEVEKQAPGVFEEVGNNPGQGVQFKTPEEEVVAAPAPTAVGGKSSGGSGSWNIPLGNIFGADISTQGNYASGTNLDDGTKTDDAWDAGLKATWTFDKGGEVPSKSIWDSVKKAASYAWKNDNKPGDRYAKNNPQVTKPAYKAIGGMTTGPLGMSDMLAAGKGKDVSKVKMKKNKGDMSEEVEVNYHAPLAPKPTGE